jgi:hypothetical protein
MAMPTKVIAGILILVVLGVALLFIDRAFVRFTLTAVPSDDSVPWVQVANQGSWDASQFSFSCTVLEAKDSNGAVVIARRRGAGFLTAWGGDLAVGDTRRYSCALPSDKSDKIAEAEMLGFATFGIRYLPLFRLRQYRILVKRDANGQLQISSIQPD